MCVSLHRHLIRDASVRDGFFLYLAYGDSLPVAV